ncbi:hypothetical protein OAD59_00430 [Flavobacteriaceae bacterium]|nr:hypothetical protein [Flavobacteriaceae bacterium]
MIKKYFVLLFFFFLTIGHAQSPEKFTYQSIIKNSSGYLLKSQDVGLKISVLFNSSNGIAVYSEEHTVESNNNGLVTLIIGEGVSSDVFSDIDWGGGEFFLKVEVDPEGGVNYVMEQTSQLLSVPYALYAGNSGSNLNLLGQDYINLTGQTLTINKVDLADDVDGVLPVVNGGTGSSTAPMVGVITAIDATDARSILGLGTAAITDSSDYATAAQGALADTALQDASVFATAAQGALADTALQASNNLSDITNVVAARTALGIDVSGTDNSTNVSLAGSLDYLTLSGQEITMGQVDYNSDISNTPTLLQLGTTSSTALAGNTTTISSAQSSAITANTAKTTNVTTDLSISGTTGARTIESSDGTDAIIPIATTDVSGLLSPSLFDEIDANTAKTGITSGQSSAITANTSKVTDSGIPALKSDGSDPSLNTGITAAKIRTLIGAASSTDNSTNVSLAGSLDYLTLSGQEITVSSITNDDLAGFIADSKLNQITTANKVAGSSVQLASGSALANSSGLNVTVDGISISMIADPELKEFAGMTPASTGQYNFIAGTGDDFKALTVSETLTALGAGTMAIQNKESVNIDGGTIDGTTIATSDITVGLGKTLDVSSGYLTVANNQISGDKIEGGTIAAITVTTLTSNKILASNKIITPAGTTGNQTIDATAGSVNFSSSDTTLTVTNNLVDANSVVILTRGTAVSANRNISVVPSSGQFIITLDASFGVETKIFFLVIN